VEAAVSALVGRVSSFTFHRCSLIFDYQYIFLQFVLCAFIYLWVMRNRISNSSAKGGTEAAAAADAVGDIN